MRTGSASDAAPGAHCVTSEGRSCSHAGRGLRCLRACGLWPGRGSGYTELPFLCCVHISVARSVPLGRIARHPRIPCPCRQHGVARHPPWRPQLLFSPEQGHTWRLRESQRIADVEVGSPPETFPSVLLFTDGEAEAQKGRGVGPGSRSMGAWTPEACGWLFPLARSYAITVLMATYFIT